MFNSPFRVARHDNSNSHVITIIFFRFFYQCALLLSSSFLSQINAISWWNHFKPNKLQFPGAATFTIYICRCCATPTRGQDLWARTWTGLKHTCKKIANNASSDQKGFWILGNFGKLNKGKKILLSLITPVWEYFINCNFFLINMFGLILETTCVNVYYTQKKYEANYI